MASIALCRAVAADGAAVEEWARQYPDHPAAAPILAAMARTPDLWAQTQVTLEERRAAFAAAEAAGYRCDFATRQEAGESEDARQAALRYLRAVQG